MSRRIDERIPKNRYEHLRYKVAPYRKNPANDFAKKLALQPFSYENGAALVHDVRRAVAGFKDLLIREQFKGKLPKRMYQCKPAAMKA